MTATIGIQGIDTLMTSIDALQPTAERTIAAKFSALYSNIERALARGVTQRSILEALEHEGLKLHPAKFKKLLDDARAQRNENGEGIRCPSCGGVQMTPPAETESQLKEGSEQ
ncbi:MAG: hypothetical protein V4645_31965 [Pseudomonadota bacterium]